LLYQLHPIADPILNSIAIEEIKRDTEFLGKFLIFYFQKKN
jgi:hypothetical protein